MVTLTVQSEHTAQFSWHNLVSMLAVATGSVLGGILPVIMSETLSITSAGGFSPRRDATGLSCLYLLRSRYSANEHRPHARLAR